MNKEKLLETIRNLRKISKKRKFSQSVDLIINLKDVDKKQGFDVFVSMPFDTGKGVKICAIVDDELKKQATGLVDRIINKEEISKLDQKEITAIGREYDIFIAQANLMGPIASSMGRILGPLGKMPNPKSGGVILPGTDIKSSVKKFKENSKLRNKNEAIFKVCIGKESFEDNQLVENADAVYEAIIHALPQGEQNVKNVLIKFTMGKPLKVGEKAEIREEKEKKDEGRKKAK